MTSSSTLYSASWSLTEVITARNHSSVWWGAWRSLGTKDQAQEWKVDRLIKMLIKWSQNNLHGLYTKDCYASFFASNYENKILQVTVQY